MAKVARRNGNVNEQMDVSKTKKQEEKRKPTRKSKI